MDNTVFEMYIARDADGSLWLFPEEPLWSKSLLFWYSRIQQGFMLRRDLYPSVTVENSPVKVIGLKLENHDIIKNDYAI